MERIVGALWGAIVDFAHNIGVLLVLNLLTSLALFPLLALLTYLLGGFGLLAAFPITAGLLVAVLPCPLATPVQVTANTLARGAMLMPLRQSIATWRQGGRLVVFLWLIGIAVTALLVGNVVFYARQSSGVAYVLRYLWLYALLLWLAMQLYVYPLVIEERTTGIIDTYRKAAALAVLFPWFTAGLVLLWLATITVLSLTGILAVAGLAFAALLQHHAVAQLLERSPLES